MRPLKIGVSGVRGIVGESMTPELVVSFAQAFGTYLDSGRILVCRDTRASGPMVQAAVVSGLLAAGCEVIDLGICPTPTLQLAVRWLGAQGGISITGGHGDSNDYACDLCMRGLGRIVDGVDEMRKAVREEIKYGADWIKLFVRRALGATRAQILGYFQTENLLLSRLGIVIGMIGAYAINQLLMGRYELPRLPLMYLPIGAVALWSLGQLSVLGPARRAAAVPPAVATRTV